MPASSRRSQKTIVFVSLLLFCLILVMIQLWLFASALMDYLSGRMEMELSAAITSTIIFGVNVWMYIGIQRVENEL